MGDTEDNCFRSYLLPSEDDDGSAAEIARLRSALDEQRASYERTLASYAEQWNATTKERDAAREDMILIDTQRVKLMDEAANMRASFESLYAERAELTAALSASREEVEAMKPVVEAVLAEADAWEERERMERMGHPSTARDNAVAAAANAIDTAVDAFRSRTKETTDAK